MGAMNYKLNFAEIKANAFGDWLNVLTRCGLDVVPKGKGWHTPCPICGGKDCFRVDDSSPDKTYMCKCSAGDGFMLLQKALGVSAYQSFEMVHNVQNGNSYSPVTPTPSPSTDETVACSGEKLERTLKYSRRTPTRDALDYYESRAITCMNKRHDFVSYGYQWYMGRNLNNTKHHVILSKISFFNQQAIGVVRIYTNEPAIQSLIPNEKVAKKPVLKGTANTLNGAGIWFSNSQDGMGWHVAEGFENGLSVAMMQDTMKVVCGNTAAGLAALEIPDHIGEITIWMDGGTAGKNAARKLYKRYCRDKIVHYRIPTDGMDWNDLIMEQK